MKETRVLNLKWIVYILISCVYAVSQKNILMYSVLLIELALIVKDLWQEKYESFKIRQMELIFISLMMPDNYLIIAIVCILLVVHLPRCEWKLEGMTMLLLAYVIFNICINSVNLNNLIFATVYNLPFLLAAYVIKKKASREPKFRESMILCAKRFVVLEACTVLVYMVSHLATVKEFIDMDWVTGTLGTYQCNTLMLICSFSFLVFLDDFLKNKKSLIWAIVALALAMSTTAVAYTLILIVTVVVVLFISREINLKLKVSAIAGVLAGLIVFLCISPSWIVNEIPKLTNVSYLQERIHKIEYYVNTFSKMPENEGVKTWLFGVGVGEYSSRAASTCAGGYIGLYDNFFELHVSEMRAKYITDQTYDIAYWGKSVVDTPGSTILALQGELGIIGLIMGLITFFRLYKDANGLIPRTIVVFFFGLMFVESVVGFLKYGIIFLLAYYATNTMDLKENEA